MGRSIALITGITGQDGSYLTELLLEQGWLVYGIMRRASVYTTERIEHLWRHPELRVRHGDMTDNAGLTAVLAEIKLLAPDRLFIFNMAAQSHVGVSFETPLYTAQVDAIGALNLLEAVRTTGLAQLARICHASTSEMYGQVAETPQTESTPFHPRSPYGVAKVYAYWIMRNYREAYGMHVCNSIGFNHESPRRGKTFVTRKITLAIGRIKRELMAGCWDDFIATHRPLQLGNLDAMRDWGHARDVVRGMFQMLEHPEPDDYVLATGECHSVREFATKAFAEAGIEITWHGTGVDEKGSTTIDGRSVVMIEINERYFRPAEVDLLQGDASKARRVLGWQPEVTFDELVSEMVHTDSGF